MKMKYPYDHPDYKHLEQCLKALKEGKIVFDIIGGEMDREKWLKQKGYGK